MLIALGQVFGYLANEVNRTIFGQQAFDVLVFGEVKGPRDVSLGDGLVFKEGISRSSGNFGGSQTLNYGRCICCRGI
ncbi:hypothetical protein RRF57_010796 [Xylaria bambusicola]|uniref:Uncharacterized protein n=1 Tax=Xylaria bambusicola TaxID=326684 RepID=A0AAN7V1Z8_9PEZI